MEQPPRIDIDELYESKQKNDINRVNLYNKLVQRVHSKIRGASRQRNNNQFCHYIMPEILIGYPNYNFNECLLYVINVLENDGFLVKYIHPNLLLISWNHWIPSYVRDEYKKKTGKTIDKFGREIEEKSTDKYSNILAKKEEDKKVRFDLKESKQKSINDKYVPSGKFIYSNELLDTIREVI